MNRIRVIIADDSDFVRDGMKIILDVDDDFEVIGVASNGREACDIAEKEKPDVFPDGHTDARNGRYRSYQVHHRARSGKGSDTYHI